MLGGLKPATHGATCRLKWRVSDHFTRIVDRVVAADRESLWLGLSLLFGQINRKVGIF